MKNIIKQIVIKYRLLTKGTVFTVNDLARLVEGTVTGNGRIFVKGLTSPAFARKDDITYASSEKTLEEAKKSLSPCIVTTLDVGKTAKTILKVKDIKYAMTVIYNAIQEMAPVKKGTIHSTARISRKAHLGRNVSVGPYTVIKKGAKIGDNTVIGANSFIGERVRIGKNCLLYPNISIYEHTLIGNKAIIHSGAVIGSDGFGFVPKGDKIYKVPQSGNVIIKDNVEIGANTCIDRGTFANTEIGENTKIDNLVQIAHNTIIGRNVFIAGQSGIAGSCEIGDGTMMGGGVGISDHSKVGKNVKIGAKSGVAGRISDGDTVFGYPVRKAEDSRKLWGVQFGLIKHSDKFRKFLRTLPSDSKRKEKKSE